ncbi:MAG: hypothetical protein J6Z01_08010 [Bacteroidales bacterium]|nr:hypothetical protein [Bacteroidales bacterium]
MYTILSLSTYGYFPTILGVCLIIFFSVIFRENWKYNTIVVCGYLILWSINLKYSGGYDIDSFSGPTLTELISNTLTWLTVYLLLIDNTFIPLGLLHVFFISFLSSSFVFGLFGFDCLLYDVFGVFFLIIMFVYFKKKSKKQAYIFLFSYLTLAFMIFCLVPQITWECLKKDYRSSEIVYLYWKHLTPDDYYLCTSIEDTEERFRQIYEVIRKPSDSTINFLEDPIAAFSFNRSSVRVSWDYDGVSHSGAVWCMKKHDSLLVGNIYYYKPYDVVFKPDEIIYKPVEEVFKYHISDSVNVAVNGAFENLSLGLLYALQQYLHQEITDLTNRRISLYNNKNEFKLGIQYFENDEYYLYLEDSFLDK